MESEPGESGGGDIGFAEELRVKSEEARLAGFGPVGKHAGGMSLQEGMGLSRESREPRDARGGTDSSRKWRRDAASPKGPDSGRDDKPDSGRERMHQGASLQSGMGFIRFIRIIRLIRDIITI